MLDDEAHHALRGEIQTLRNILFVAQRRRAAGDVDPGAVLADLETLVSAIEQRCDGVQMAATGMADAPVSAEAIAAEQIGVLRHDLRNKLMAVRNAVAYIERRAAETDLAKDARVARFFRLIEDEVGAVEHLLAKK